MLSQLLPDWELVHRSEEYRDLPERYDAYNITWLCLSGDGAGGLLKSICWAGCSGVCSKVRASPHLCSLAVVSIRAGSEWPKFRNTPPALRDIIDRCTSGRRAPMTSLIIRRGSKLVFRNDPPGFERDPTDVLNAARSWWIRRGQTCRGVPGGENEAEKQWPVDRQLLQQTHDGRSHGRPAGLCPSERLQTQELHIRVSYTDKQPTSKKKSKKKTIGKSAHLLELMMPRHARQQVGAITFL